MSLLFVDTATFWQDIELRLDSDSFWRAWKIFKINKKSGSNRPLKPKAPFKWVFMDIIPTTSSKSLINYTTLANYLLILDDYSKTPKLYDMENITTKEGMDKLDMF